MEEAHISVEKPEIEFNIIDMEDLMEEGEIRLDVEEEELVDEERRKLISEVEAMFDDLQEEEGEASTSAAEIDSELPAYGPETKEEFINKINEFFKQPFLEDKCRKLFVKRIRELDSDSIWGIEKKSKQFNKEIYHFLKAFAKRKEDVFSRSPITMIKSFYQINLWKCSFPVFEVLRRDGSVSKIIKSDFMHLRLEDMEYMYKVFRTKITRSQTILMGSD